MRNKKVLELKEDVLRKKAHLFHQSSLHSPEHPSCPKIRIQPQSSALLVAMLSQWQVGDT